MGTRIWDMETFVVRIFRRDAEDRRRVVGVVEELGVKERRAFHNLDDLWAILASPKRRGPRKRRPRSAGE